jgi:prepilin-type N-terminal cleavage/methylation domain-containing protein
MSGGVGLLSAPPPGSRHRSERRQTRRGFTLLELAIVLGILGVVGSAIGLTLVRQQRFYRGTEQLVGAREGVRDAIEILSTDIRGMSIADTARLLADSAVEIFGNVGSSVVCQIAGSEIGLPAGASPRGNTLTALLIQPDTGDLALFLRDSADGGSLWERHRIAAFSARSTATTCPPSTGFAAADDASATGTAFVVVLSTSLTDHVHRGAPVRFVRRGRYSLYRSSDESWYLGYRRCNALGPSVCGAIQPLSGPYRAYSSNPRSTGLLFEFFDRSGDRLPIGSSSLALARVDITARSESRQSLAVEGRSWMPADSATVSIGVRNRGQ